VPRSVGASAKFAARRRPNRLHPRVHTLVFSRHSSGRGDAPDDLCSGRSVAPLGRMGCAGKTGWLAMTRVRLWVGWGRLGSDVGRLGSDVGRLGSVEVRLGAVVDDKWVLSRFA